MEILTSIGLTTYFTHLTELQEHCGCSLQLVKLDGTPELPDGFLTSLRSEVDQPTLLHQGDELHVGVAFNSTHAAVGKFNITTNFERQLASQNFRLAVQTFLRNRELVALREETASCTEHLAVQYEKTIAISELAQQLRITHDLNEVLHNIAELICDALNVEACSIFGNGIHVSTSNIEDSEYINAFLVQLQKSKQECVFRDTQINPDESLHLLATRLRLTDHDGWIVIQKRNVERSLGSDEAQFLMTLTQMLESYFQNLQHYTEKDEMTLTFVKVLSSALDARDTYTQGHSVRVARLARLLAREMGLPSTEVDQIFLSGLLHDLGKIGIADAVLLKEGNLTDEEWSEIQQHPVVGYDILKSIVAFEPILPGVRHHHEAFDGSGYPDQLSGNEIPLMARIMAVADAFDAMRSDRPYRFGMDAAKVHSVLNSGAGRQWDENIIELFNQHHGEIEKQWSIWQEELNGTPAVNG